jgi:hypothetical protein
MTEIELDPIRRLRLVAAGLRGGVVVEGVLDAPFNDVWSAATDFEHTVSRLEVLIGKARILSRDGERLVMDIWPPLMGPAMRMDVVLRPGWCLMQTRMTIAGMAARPEGERTRFAHLEAWRLPGRRIAGGLLLAKMHAVDELGRIERVARERRASE